MHAPQFILSYSNLMCHADYESKHFRWWQDINKSIVQKYSTTLSFKSWNPNSKYIHTYIYIIFLPIWNVCTCIKRGYARWHRVTWQHDIIEISRQVPVTPLFASISVSLPTIQTLGVYWAKKQYRLITRSVLKLFQLSKASYYLARALYNLQIIKIDGFLYIWRRFWNTI